MFYSRSGHGTSREVFLPDSRSVQVQEHGGTEFFTRFETEMNKKFEEVNKSLDKAISEQKNAAERAASEMKQDILSLQKSVQEIVKALDEKPSAWRKNKIPTELSAVVKSLHEKCAEQFNPAESIQSSHNSTVVSRLVEQLSGKYSSTFSPKRMRRAVSRYYESRRRLFNDAQPTRIEKALKMKKNCQKKAYRKQLYDRRKKHLKNDKERGKWMQIDYRYMTEESDMDEEKVGQHKLPWRSNKLNELVSKLDSRIKSSAKSGGFKSKDRFLCSPSTLQPPCDAAKWTITEEYLQDATPSRHDTASLDATPSSGHMPGVSAALEVINSSTPQNVPRAVTQRRLNMSSAAVVNSSVSITDNSTSMVINPASMVINPQCLQDELDVASDNSDSDSDDSISSSD